MTSFLCAFSRSINSKIVRLKALEGLSLERCQKLVESGDPSDKSGGHKSRDRKGFRSRIILLIVILRSSHSSSDRLGRAGRWTEKRNE